MLARKFREIILLSAYFAGVVICTAFAASQASAQKRSGQLICVADQATDQTPKGAVYFSLNSTRLSEKSRCELRRIAAIAREGAASKVLITGHADQLGDQQYNLALSQRRASNVLKNLRLMGVHPRILKIDWKGEFEPAVPTEPEQPQELNRRVEIAITF